MPIVSSTAKRLSRLVTPCARLTETHAGLHSLILHLRVATWVWLGIFSAWGVTRKFFGLLLVYRWGSLVPVGISLVSLGLVGTWWLLAETAIKPIIVG
jgi:hypothetical protein